MSSSNPVQWYRLLRPYLGKVMLFLMIGLAGCGGITIQQLGNSNQDQLRQVAVANIGGRDGQLFSREVRRLLYLGAPAPSRYELQTKISFSASSTLSVQGASSTLKKASMSASFKLVDLTNGKTIMTDNVAGDATTGTVTSLYGQDKSESHARERLALLLAQRTVRQIQLYFLNQKP